MEHSETPAVIESVEAEQNTLTVIQETVPTPKVTGLADACLIGSTTAFTLLIALPVAVLLLCVLAVLIFDLSTTLLGISTLEASHWGLSILLALGTITCISLLSGLYYALGLEEEERVQRSYMGLLLKTQFWSIGTMMGVIMIASKLLNLGPTLGLGCAIATTITATFGAAWLSSKWSWRGLLKGIQSIRQHPFIAGVWTTLTSGVSIISALLMIGVWGAAPEMLQIAQDNQWNFQKFGQNLENASQIPTNKSHASKLVGLSNATFKVNPSIEQQRLDACFKQLSSPKPSARDHAVEYLRHKLVSYSDAEDIVQTTLLKVCLRYSKHSIDDLISYFYKSVKHTRYTTGKKKWTRSCLTRQWDLGRTDRWQKPDDLEEFKQIMCRKLSVEEKEILLLVAEGRNSTEIGEQLSIPPATARKRIQRAKNSLRVALNH